MSALYRGVYRLVDGVRSFLFRVTRRSTLGARAIIFDGEGRVVLIRHTYVWGWQLPGGGVKRGESALEGARREAAEEAGVILDQPEKMLGIYLKDQPWQSDHVVVYVFRGYSPVPGFKLPSHEIAEAGFFSLENLPSDTTAATRRRLNECVQGVAVPLCW